MLSRWREQGDTIIEVLLAITVFSMVAVGGIAIMNQGTNTAQRAVEITLVRQQIDAQAEVLRAVHQAAAREDKVGLGKTGWSNITGPSTGSYTGSDCPTEPTTPIPSGSFAMNPSTAERLTGTWFDQFSPVTDPPYAKISTGGTKSYGIWIERTAEGVGLNNGTPGIYTFTIRACWEGAGLAVPMRLETVVRLYEL